MARPVSNLSSPHGFLEKPVNAGQSECDLAVLGVPCDLATTGRPGARMGPNGIRQASWHMSWEKRRWPWRFALNDRLRVADFGDIEFGAGDSAQLVKVLQARVREILAADKTLLSLGGDHFVSLPLVREHAAKHGPASLIHFDAHADTEPIERSVNHGNMFRQACQEGVVDLDSDGRPDIIAPVNDAWEIVAQVGRYAMEVWFNRAVR